MRKFDLRKTHTPRWWFDTAAGVLVLLGGVVGWWGISRGGIWIVPGAVGAFGALLVVWGSLVTPRRLKVRHYPGRLTKDPQTEIRLVLLTDLHAGGFRKSTWYERIVQETNALHPDAVLLGGDFVCYRHEPMEDLAALERIQAPKYFVLGNHDFLDRADLVRRYVAELGIEDLTNRKITLEKEGKTLEIGGVDSLWSGKPLIPRRSSSETPFILLSHEPDVLLDLKEGEADLVLSGHTHGGQIRLPFVGNLWPIPSRLGRAVERGRKTVFGIPIIISEGLGEPDSRARLFTHPEIAVIEIKI